MTASPTSAPRGNSFGIDESQDPPAGYDKDVVQAQNQGVTIAAAAILMVVVLPRAVTVAEAGLFALARLALLRAPRLAPAVGLGVASSAVGGRQQGCSGSGCGPRIPITNLGGAGERIGVISLGPAGTRIVVAGRGAGDNLTHQALGKQVFGVLSEGERRIGFFFLQNDLLVSETSAGKITTSDIPTITSTIIASGITYLNAFIIVPGSSGAFKIP